MQGAGLFEQEAAERAEFTIHGFSASSCSSCVGQDLLSGLRNLCGTMKAEDREQETVSLAVADSTLPLQRTPRNLHRALQDRIPPTD